MNLLWFTMSNALLSLICRNTVLYGLVESFSLKPLETCWLKLLRAEMVSIFLSIYMLSFLFINVEKKMDKSSRKVHIYSVFFFMRTKVFVHLTHLKFFQIGQTYLKFIARLEHLMKIHLEYLTAWPKDTISGKKIYNMIQ